MLTGTFHLEIPLKCFPNQMISIIFAGSKKYRLLYQSYYFQSERLDKFWRTELDPKVVTPCVDSFVFSDIVILQNRKLNTEKLILSDMVWRISHGLRVKSQTSESMLSQRGSVVWLHDQRRSSMFPSRYPQALMQVFRYILY
jgi:hypothetical protein